MIFASNIVGPVIARLTLLGEKKIYYRDFCKRLKDCGQGYPGVLENIEFGENSSGIFSTDVAQELGCLARMRVLYQAEEVKGPYFIMPEAYAKNYVDNSNPKFKDVVLRLASQMHAISVKNNETYQ